MGRPKYFWHPQYLYNKHDNLLHNSITQHKLGMNFLRMGKTLMANYKWVINKYHKSYGIL